MKAKNKRKQLTSRSESRVGPLGSRSIYFTPRIYEWQVWDRLKDDLSLNFLLKKERKQKLTSRSESSTTFRRPGVFFLNKRFFNGRFCRVSLKDARAMISYPSTRWDPKASLKIYQILAKNNENVRHLEGPKMIIFWINPNFESLPPRIWVKNFQKWPFLTIFGYLSKNRKNGHFWKFLSRIRSSKGSKTTLFQKSSFLKLLKIEPK